jgi:hypothetical protein
MNPSAPSSFWKQAFLQLFQRARVRGRRPRPSLRPRLRLFTEPLEDRTLLSGMPVVYPATVDTDGTHPVTVNVLANATDTAGPGALLPGTVHLASQPNHGTVSINPQTGAITYTAGPGFMGTDAFLCTVSDNQGATASPATITVVVHRPTAADDGTDTDGSTPVTVHVLANDTDPDGNQHLVPGSVTLVGHPAHGAAVVNADGTITYTATAAFTGTDTFQYTVKDDNGATSNVATVSIRVNRPTAADDWTDTDGSTPVTINVLANDTDPDGNQHLVPGSVTLVSHPAHGTAVVRADGTIIYTATAGFTGTDSFKYTVSDDNGATSTPATVQVRINRPTAADDWTDTDGSTPVTINVLANDTDPDGNQHLLPGSVTLVSHPTHGTAVVSPDGTITYTATAGFTGTDSFKYTVSDDNGATSLPATVSVRVNRPTAADDWTDTDGTTPVTINVLANDTDPDGNQHLVPGSVTLVSNPTHGTAVVNPDGTITYTAMANFTGNDSFKYTVSDDNGATSLPATVTIRANRPTAADDWADTDGTTPVTINVLANDTDPDGNQHLVPGSVTLVSHPTHGTAVVNPDGTITYTAMGNLTGTDTFTYTVMDDNGATSNAATVLVRVNRPTATADFGSVTGTSPITLNVLANDTDPDGIQHLVASSVTLVSNPSHGTAVVNADGTITYTPASNFTGTDTFTYTVMDDNGATSNAATVTIVGVRPMGPSDTFTMIDGNPATPIPVLTGAHDLESGVSLVPGSVTLVVLPMHGTAVANADGTATYTPFAGFMGTDTFQFTVADTLGMVSPTTLVSVGVVHPIAADDWMDTDGSTPVTVSVLDNDTSSIGNQHLVAGSVALVGSPAHGTAVVNADGTITYTATAGFTGTDTVQYTVKDDNGATSNQGTLSIRVNRPTAANDWTDTDGTTPVTINVLANDTDPDGNQHLLPGSVTLVTHPAHGTAVVNADGTITYTATAGFTGTDNFTYTVSDDNGATSSPAVVQVRINRPTAADDWADTDGSTPVTVNVLANDTDPDGNQHLVPSSVTLVTHPARGTAVVNADGTITYTGTAGFTGTDSFTYTVSDDNGATSTPATVQIRMNRPTAADDWTDTDGSTPVTVHVLANDTDPDGNQHLVPGSVALVSNPAHGTATVNPDGTITYTATAGFTGTDTFTYTVSDDNGATSAPATVSVRINRPTAADDGTDTDGSTPVTINVLANDTDPDGNQHLVPSSVTFVSHPTNGIAVVNPDGTITYTAFASLAGFTGTDSFTYTVSDDNGATSLPATVFVRINRPTTNDDFAATPGLAPVTINVLANDSDPDGNQHLVPGSVTITHAPGTGTAVVNPDGTITYTPFAGATGTDTLQYTVRDDNGATSAPATVTINVNLPTALPDSAVTMGTNPVTIPVLANDSDPNGPTALLPGTVHVTVAPAHGTVTIDPTSGAITYTAAAGFAGTDTFSYTVTDNHGTVSPAAPVSVTVLPTPVTGGPGTGSPISVPPIVTSHGPTVRVVDAQTGGVLFVLHPFGRHFRGGIHTTLAEINGVLELITAPAHGTPRLRIYNAETGQLIRNFLAFAGSQTHGVLLTTADLNGDGQPDIVSQTLIQGKPRVHVFDGVSETLLASYDARSPGLPSVSAAREVTNGIRHVQLFHGLTRAQLDQFFASNPNLQDGFLG